MYFSFDKDINVFKLNNSWIIKHKNSIDMNSTSYLSLKNPCGRFSSGILIRTHNEHLFLIMLPLSIGGMQKIMRNVA